MILSIALNSVAGRAQAHVRSGSGLDAAAWRKVFAGAQAA
jgi:hypothetical protein